MAVPSCFKGLAGVLLIIEKALRLSITLDPTQSTTHAKQAEKYQCPQCDAAYVYQSGLALHIRQKHSKSLTCPKCHYVENSSSKIKKHSCNLRSSLRRRRIPVLSKLKCPSCAEVFNTVVAYNKHAKPFRCTKCKYKSSNKNDLEVHAMTHKNSTTYHCESCDRWYKHRTSLQTHLRSHTSQYECEACAKTFLYPSTLRRHVFKAHSAVESQ